MCQVSDDGAIRFYIARGEEPGSDEAMGLMLQGPGQTPLRASCVQLPASWNSKLLGKEERRNGSPQCTACYGSPTVPCDSVFWLKWKRRSVALSL